MPCYAPLIALCLPLRELMYSCRFSQFHYDFAPMMLLLLSPLMFSLPLPLLILIRLI